MWRERERLGERKRGWKLDSEKTALQRRGGSRKELRLSCSLKKKKKKKSFVFFTAQHVFQFGDAVPLFPPNRAGKSLGSTANR